MKKALISLLSMFFVAGALSGCSFFKIPDDSSSADSSVQASEDVSNSLEESSETPDVSEESSEEETTEYCTITFKQPGQPDVVKQVEKGEAFTDTPAPVDKIGYTVDWDCTGVDFANITADIVINAVETPNTYTVSYDCGRGTMPEGVEYSQTVTYDSVVTHPVPVCEGWEFVAWMYEGAAISEKWTIADDVTLTAEWLDVRPEYTIKFVQDGQPDVEFTVKKHENLDVNLIPVPVQTPGYVTEWDKSAIDFTNVQANITVKTVVRPDTYTFEYIAEGTSVHGKWVVLEYNELCTGLEMDVYKEGYKFVGWEYDGVTYTNESVWKVVFEDYTLKYLNAVFIEKDKLAVTFVHADGSTEVKDLYLGDTLYDQPIPKDKVGYTVDKEYWYKEPECIRTATFYDITEDVTFYAKATPNTYTITFNTNGGVLDSDTMTVTYDAAYTLPTPTHTNEFMQFVCWKDENGATIADGTWKKDGGATLTAQWANTQQKFTVSFVQAGQETKTYTDVLEGSDFTEIPAPAAKTGYNVEWKAEDLAKLNNISGNVVVNAVETAKTYTITLNANGGTVASATITVTYDATYELPTPTHENKFMSFVAWKDENGAVVANGTWTTDSDVTLTAEWTNVQKTFTVTFKQDGQADKTYDVKEGESFTEIPAVVEKTGYTVVWNADELAQLNNVSGNVVVNAVETAKTYTITLKANGGSVSETTITVTYGQAYELPTPTFDDDHIFQGWMYGETKVELTGVWTYDVEGMELVAAWKEVGWTNNY